MLVLRTFDRQPPRRQCAAFFDADEVLYQAKTSRTICIFDIFEAKGVFDDMNAEGLVCCTGESNAISSLGDVLNKAEKSSL